MAMAMAMAAPDKFRRRNLSGAGAEAGNLKMGGSGNPAIKVSVGQDLIHRFQIMGNRSYLRVIYATK